MIAREKWLRGTWDTEPDRDEFMHRELHCLALRGPFGSWCGYVAVPVGHPLYGIAYHGAMNWEPKDEVQRRIFERGKQIREKNGKVAVGKAPEEVFDIHGGLTYSGASDGMRGIEGDGRWWFGFDCSHYGDLSPALAAYGSALYEDAEYRDLEYVRRETRRLADQIADWKETT
jgi:hypothetical protein